MKSDVQIASEAVMLPISQIADKIGVIPDELVQYGNYIAKINQKCFDRVKDNKDGKLILVTAVNPTPAGEGKTTTTIGLGQALNKLNKNAIIALREPSLGPVFGIKGGAAGGGYSQAVPMADINLHFTGDLHAVTAANNLICAILDNHIFQGNELNIDPNRILVKRTIDMNDRAIRNVIIGMDGKLEEATRSESFTITVASEIMAILCLANDLQDLKEKVKRILVAYDMNGNPIFCKDLKIEGAVAVLLKDAINPNLVQTLENTPCIIHGGPFANIAHGCNSVRATKLALKLGDYVVTEAGFGADLGAEKFFDIKCKIADLKPDAVVLVATIRALKYNGGVDKTELTKENVEALLLGLENLKAHVDNLKKFGLIPIVCINSFPSDTDREVQAIKKYCDELGVKCIVSYAFRDGGEGAIELANEVIKSADGINTFNQLYDYKLPLKDKINIVAKKIYGADNVIFESSASEMLDEIDKMGYSELPICIAKTQYSLSDDPKKLGRPKNFDLTVREVRLSSGAGFVVCLTGKIMMMPGLSKKPSAEMIDIDAQGNIVGLF